MAQLKIFFSDLSEEKQEQFKRLILDEIREEKLSGRDDDDEIFDPLPNEQEEEEVLDYINRNDMGIDYFI